MPPRPPCTPPPAPPPPLLQPRPPPASCPAAAGRAPEAARQRLRPLPPPPRPAVPAGWRAARLSWRPHGGPCGTPAPPDTAHRCHLAPLPPLPHPVLHSFPLGTSPTGLHNPAALRRRLRRRHTPPRVLSPRRNRLRRRLLGPFRPRGDSRERLRYQLAGVSPFRRGSPTPHGCPPVLLQGLREQLADVSRASHCRLLRCIPRPFPRRSPPHGGRALHPTRRGQTPTRHHWLRVRRHHGRGFARHGRVRHLGRPRW